MQVKKSLISRLFVSKIKSHGFIADMTDKYFFFFGTDVFFIAINQQNCFNIKGGHRLECFDEIID